MTVWFEASKNSQEPSSSRPLLAFLKTAWGGWGMNWWGMGVWWMLGQEMDKLILYLFLYQNGEERMVEWRWEDETYIILTYSGLWFDNAKKRHNENDQSNLRRVDDQEGVNRDGQVAGSRGWHGAERVANVTDEDLMSVNRVNLDDWNALQLYCMHT